MQTMEVLVKDISDYTNEMNLPTHFEKVQNFHQSFEGYEQTPLHRLQSLAEALQVSSIWVKDESYRFGLNAFKGLGVSYALDEIIQKNPEKRYTFVSCTDGNHGRALAWRAQMLGHQAIIFMPKGSEERRVKAIEQFNAKVVVTAMNYDDTVRYAADYAKANGYVLVQDTALPDNTEVPNDIVLGYSTMAAEALNQMPEKPTHVFLQAGVGSMAGGVLWYLYQKYGEELPFVGIIEADTVACFYESIRSGKVVNIGGEPYTLMAGLNCGECNLATFPLIKAKARAFIKCQDAITLKGMARAKHPMGSDPAFSSGESGAVGLGFVEEVLSQPEFSDLKTALQLNAQSKILLFSTEGVLKED